MKPISRRAYAITAIVLAAIIFAALNIAVDAGITTARLDLTENGLYTLAPGTRNILANLKEPVTLRFYYSKGVAADYAQVSSYATRVRDLLEQYAALSHGKLIVHEIDPEPFTQAEDEATALGLSGVPTDSGDMVYFGLVGTNTIDGQEVVPYFNANREQYLEYDLSSLIYRLSQPKKATIGVISGLPLDTGAGGMAAMLQGQSSPFVIYQQLAQSYAMKTLDPNFTQIPSGVNVLLIVHPPELAPQQVYAIDQFVLAGGRALVFVDPLSEVSQQSAGMGGAAPIMSSMPALFQTWGFSFTGGKLVADRELAQHVQTSSDPRNPVSLYPIWLHLTKPNFDPTDQITANLQALNLASAGALKPLPGATTTFTSLMRSSNEASLLDAEQVRINPNPQQMMNDIAPTGERFTLAARITGRTKTAFRNGAPPPPAGAPPAAVKPQLKNSVGNINVVVMADTDIFDDKFWVRIDNLLGKQIATPFADNGAFVLNAVENLTGSTDLITLRTRATNDRPFTRVQKLQTKAEVQFKAHADALQQKMQETEARLRALQQGGTGNGQPATAQGLTPEQQAEIARFQRDLSDTRGQLREVQHRLRREIDALGSILAFINIALVPLLVALFALGLVFVRSRRRARAIPM